MIKLFEDVMMLFLWRIETRLMWASDRDRLSFPVWDALYTRY